MSCQPSRRKSFIANSRRSTPGIRKCIARNLSRSIARANMGIAHLRLPRLVSISRASKCCPDILLKQAPFFLSHRVRLAASQHHGNTGSRFPRQAFGHAAEIRNAGHHEPSQEQDVPHSLHRLSSTNMLSPRLRGAIASRHRTKGERPAPEPQQIHFADRRVGPPFLPHPGMRSVLATCGTGRRARQERLETGKAALRCASTCFVLSLDPGETSLRK